jgi:quercetin dioxygenase-like cupin family protein
MTDLQPAFLVRKEDCIIEDHDWGHLVWMVSGRLGNSETMTVGRCHLNPGQQNPRHYHPNCDEVLHVLRGSIEHSCGVEVFPMQAGETVSIPTGVVHNARNVGTEEAVLLIAFSSAHRQVVGE